MNTLRDALNKAYALGFSNSGEGYNGEYPFDGRDFEQDAKWIEYRDAALAALDAETEVKVLHGPYGWLIKPHGYLLKPIGLNEEYWTLSTEPSEFPADVVSVPLFAREPQMPGDEAPEKRVATVGQEWLIARLKEALKPLAQYADWYERIYGVNCDDGREVPCRMAHLRRARDVSSHVPALDAETAVKVRELKWTEKFSGTWWTSEAYRIELTDGGGFAARVSHPQSRSFRTIGIFSEISAAKAAAQADYERRIRSALVTPGARS